MAMDRDELIKKMRGRIDMCLRLAKQINDPQAAQALREMAEEGERDLKALEAERTEAVTIKPIQS